MIPTSPSLETDVQKQELFDLLEKLSRRYPAMRLGQLVANVAYWAKGPTKSAVWDVEDSELKRAIEEHLQTKADD